MVNAFDERTKSDRLATYVLCADALIASGVAVVAALFFKLPLEGLTLFLLVTLGLSLVIAGLLKIDDRGRDEKGEEKSKGQSDAWQPH